MSSNSSILLNNFCRTCMNCYEEGGEFEGQTRNILSIFNETYSKECKNKTIMELLLLTIPQLSIDSDDMLPKKLCESCLDRLINAYKFQRMCTKVECKLREMVKENPVRAEVNNDPLKDLSQVNVVDLQTVNDFTHILKIEIDESPMDQISISENIKFEMENCQVEGETNSDLSDHNASENDIPFNKAKRNYVQIENLKDNTVKEEEDNNEICDNSQKNSKLPKLGEDDGSNFKYDECGNRLSTRRDLKRHKQIHLRRAEIDRKSSLVKTKYQRRICEKVLQQQTPLSNPLKKYTNEQTYLCSECGKAFKSLSNMKQHFLRHGTERPYVCPECPKRFPCRSDLASHKAVHNKIKSHVCDICGAAFGRTYLLKRHNMYHSGEKKHKCDYCDKRFVLADQCRRHMRSHTGEKPYKCTYCERAYGQRKYLMRHLRGHLGDSVYKCDLCPQGFRLQGDLREHYCSHKNDDEETKSRNLQALRNEEQRLQMKLGLTQFT